MNSDYILKLALKFRNEHKADTIQLIAHNQDELMCFISNFPILIQSDFIIPISDNYDLTSYDIPGDILFEFKLTSKALDYYKNQNLM